MAEPSFNFKPYKATNFFSAFNLPTTSATKSLFGNTTSKNGIFSTIGSPSGISSFFNTSSNDIGVKSVWGRVVAYLLAILIIVFAILLFVHFFITPVFQLKPGGSGIIPVPGFDDGKLYWNKGDSVTILNKNTQISDITCNYSLTMDIFIENPLQFSKQPRILFDRGALRKGVPTDDTILGMYEYYNLAVALLPDVNDLLISTQNKDNNMENILIPNVPVQEPFRLGIVLMTNAMEVYINGHLMKTRTFVNEPKHSIGDINGPTGINTNTVKVRNLKIWPRVITTSEIRNVNPSLASLKEFNASSMSVTTSNICNAK